MPLHTGPPEIENEDFPASADMPVGRGIAHQERGITEESGAVITASVFARSHLERVLCED